MHEARDSLSRLMGLADWMTAREKNKIFTKTICEITTHKKEWAVELQTYFLSFARWCRSLHARLTVTGEKKKKKGLGLYVC